MVKCQWLNELYGLQNCNCSQLWNLQVCIALSKKKAIHILSVTEDKIIPLKEIPLPDPPLHMVRIGVRASVFTLYKCNYVIKFCIHLAKYCSVHLRGPYCKIQTTKKTNQNSPFHHRPVRIGNSTVSRGIWDKYREWYFKIHQNIASRRGKWYLGSFEISRAGIYPKYPEETVLFFVYTTRQRNFVFHITHEHIFI